jgi:hypothetical protein
MTTGRINQVSVVTTSRRTPCAAGPASYSQPAPHSARRAAMPLTPQGRACASSVRQIHSIGSLWGGMEQARLRPSAVPQPPCSLGSFPLVAAKHKACSTRRACVSGPAACARGDCVAS